MTLALALAIGCSNGTTAPSPTAAPSPAVSVTPTSAATSPAAAAPEFGDLDGLCENVGDGSPPTLPPLVAIALDVRRTEIDPSHSTRYANAEVCRFTPPSKATPYAEFLWGRPEVLTYDVNATSPTRADEPSLPGRAYSFTGRDQFSHSPDDSATVALRLTGGGEMVVTVAGLGAANRAAAVRLAAAAVAIAAAG